MPETSLPSLLPLPVIPTPRGFTLSQLIFLAEGTGLWEMHGMWYLARCRSIAAIFARLSVGLQGGNTLLGSFLARNMADLAGAP